MSKIQIEIPDDRWFRGEEEIRPHDKQLCVVITKELFPIVCQFRKTKHSKGVFINIGHADLGFLTFVFWDKVRFWKAFEIPTEVNERILAEIEELCKKKDIE